MRPAIVSLVFILAAAALLLPSTSALDLDRAVRSFCSHTIYSDLCVNSIKETAPAIKTLNSETALAALMRAISAKAHEGKAFALRLAQHSAANAKTLELLRDCADAYETALGNLAAAAKAARAGDRGSRDALIGSMIPNFGSCEDGFDEFNIKSPMASRTQTLKNMVDNCLAVVNMGRA